MTFFLFSRFFFFLKPSKDPKVIAVTQTIKILHVKFVNSETETVLPRI